LTPISGRDRILVFMPGDREDEIDNGRSRSGISEIMKKALFASIGAVFMTEESVRTYISDAKLPREIRNFILQNTTQAKEQFFGYLSKELTDIVMRSDLPNVLRRFLSDHTIEIEAKTAAFFKATPAGIAPPASPATVPPPALAPGAPPERSAPPRAADAPPS
jgi:hypothetical protein